MKIAAILAAAVCSLSQAQAEMIVPTSSGPYKVYDKSVALVIYVSEYTGSSTWSALPGAKRSAERLGRALENKWGFDEVTYLRNPTGQELRETVRNFLISAPPDGRAIVYFAGHGYSGSHDEFETGYMVPKDAPSATASLVDFQRVALSTHMLEALAQESNAKHSLIIADSCFSGALFTTRAERHEQGDLRTEVASLPVTFWRNIERKAFHILTAGNEEQTVPANSPLVDSIERALDGEADSRRRGFITVGGLHNYLWDELAEKSLTPAFGMFKPANYVPGGQMVLLTSYYEEALARGVEGDEIENSEPSSIDVEEQPLTPGALVPDGVINKEALAVSSAYELQLPSGEPPVRHVGNLSSNVREEELAAQFLASGAPIYYWRSLADRRAVFKSIEPLRVTYEASPAVKNAQASNALVCYPDSDLSLIKTVALSLLENGIALKVVSRQERPLGLTGGHVVITSLPVSSDVKPLKPSQIRRLKSCESINALMEEKT